MKYEIERKFLISKKQNLENIVGVLYERYFLYIDDIVEIRIQKKGLQHELERKIKKEGFLNEKIKIMISKGKFDTLKLLSNQSVIRKSYCIADSPKISIKVYEKKFEGLSRVEVEFKSTEEAKNFKPLEWFGEEITHSPIGRDSKLIKLSDLDFKNFINS